MTRRQPRKEYKTFAERLRLALDKAGVTQMRMAEDLDFSRSMMTNYVQAKSMPESDRLYRMAEYLEVAPAWLFGADVNPDGTARDSITQYGLEAITRQTIPLLGAVACGQPIYATEDLEALVAVGDEIDADFALRCKGDSMIDAGIYDGDIVFVKKCETVPNGAIAVVLIEDEATLKRVYRTDSELQLLAENKMYPAIIVRESDHRDVRILGAAVAYTHKIQY